MGMFSYMCKGCKKNIRENERAVIYYLEAGRVVEMVSGPYDNYGFSESFSTLPGIPDSQSEWERKVHTHYWKKDRTYGFQAWHGLCLSVIDKLPTSRSRDCSRQGDGNPRDEFLEDVTVPRKFLKVEKRVVRITQAELWLEKLLTMPELNRKRIDKHTEWTKESVRDLLDKLDKERRTPLAKR